MWQTERYNRFVLAMLRNYVGEHQDEWESYASTLTYAYNTFGAPSTGELGISTFSAATSAWDIFMPPPGWWVPTDIRADAGRM